MVENKDTTPVSGILTTTYVVTAVNQMCLFIYFGVLPFLFKQHGVDPLVFGYVQSAASLLQLCASPVLGRVADLAGSRSVLVLAMISSSLAHLLLGVATSVPMLIMSRMASIFMDIMPASQMLVTDVVTEQERGRALGRVMIPMSLGMIVGPTLGGTLSKYLGSQGAPLVACVAPLICLLLIFTNIPSETKKHTTPKTDKKKGIDWDKLHAFLFKGDIPYLLLMRVLSTLPGMLFMMNFAVAGIHHFKLSPQGNGLVISCLGIMNMINNWFTIGYISRKVSNPGHLMRLASVLSVVTYFLMSQASEVWHVVALLFPLNLSYAIMENQVMTRLTKSVPPDGTSTMVGIGTALFHFSRTISPTLGGALMQKMGWPAIGNLGFLASLLMAALALLKTF